MNNSTAGEIQAIAGETASNSSNQPPTPREPHIIPKKLPPRRVKKFDATNLPADGTWVKVTTNERNRVEQYEGRVMFATTERIRLKQGGGWWDIKFSDVTSIVEGDDPRNHK